VGSVREKHGAWYWERYIDKKQKMERLGSTAELVNKQAAVDEANRRWHAAPPTPAGDTNGTNTRIADFAENYWLPMTKETTAASTHGEWFRSWNRTLKAHVGALTFAQYRTSYASDFFNTQARSGGAKGQGLAQNSVKHLREQLSHLFAYAVERDLLMVNPIHGAKQRVDGREAVTQIYTFEETVRILAALDGPGTAKEHAVMTLALYCGMRRGEISGLRWQDVNLTDGYLRVEQAAWQGKAKATKTKQSRRPVTLGPVAVASLARWRQQSRDGATYVFENEAHGPLELGTFSSRHLRAVFKVLNLKWRGYHAGRRCSVTEVRNATPDRRLQAAIHGHSVEVADKHYDDGPDAAAQRALMLALDAKLAAAITDSNGQRVQ
jgi:integrase